VTPLRKIGAGLFVTAGSFLIIAWIESRIQAGIIVSVWWQILAYVVLTAGEVLVSITGLEYSYKQAPLSMKSFIMALFLLSVSAGNLFTAAVNHYMMRPLPTTRLEVGVQTWLNLASAAALVPGQKIDFAGKSGVEVLHPDGSVDALEGTYLVQLVDAAGVRLQLMDAVTRQSLVTRGTFDAGKANVSTYALVGPGYFTFFAATMGAVGVLFVLVAVLVPEATHLRGEAGSAAAA
jgi:POT family proton-dependent oligopeptide transporter